MATTAKFSQQHRSRFHFDAADAAQRLALPAVWIVVAIVFAFALPGIFLSSGNISTIFGSQTVLVFATLALVIPLTAGDYDLSISATLALANMTLALLTVQHGWALMPAIAAALFVGVLVGLVNGGLVTLFAIDSLVVTLGTSSILYGLVLWVSSSNTISGIPSDLVSAVVGTSFLGIPLQFYYGLLLAAAIWFVFEYTTLGRRLLFVGRGRAVSRLSGIRVNRLRWGSFVASGVLAAAGGVIWGGTTGAADPSSSQAFLLPAFAAAFLGATSIMPGRFNPWGSIVAVYFLVTGTTGFQLLGVETFVQQVFYGVALVVAVALSQIARRRREGIEDEVNLE
ncbi:MAG TPA: ABC transporter permease [Solirubrobacterales bacterium]|jgi:ribose transport system permease protein